MGRSDTVAPVPAASAGFGSGRDARWKLAATLVAIGVTLSLVHLSTAVAALVGALALTYAAKVPARWLAERLGIVLFAVGLFALPLPLLLAGPDADWEWGPVRVSARGAVVGLLLAVRALTVVTLSLFLIATTPLDVLLRGARGVGIPGLLVQVAMMTYRYVFVLMSELQRLRIAVRVRGFRNRPSRHAYRTAGQVAGTLLVRGHDRADRVYHAMLCRGFDGQFRSRTVFQTRFADVAWFGMVVAPALGLVVLDRFVF